MSSCQSCSSQSPLQQLAAKYNKVQIPDPAQKLLEEAKTGKSSSTSPFDVKAPTASPDIKSYGARGSSGTIDIST